VTLSSSDVHYAGLAPGSISGLYQIDVRALINARRRDPGDNYDRRIPDAIRSHHFGAGFTYTVIFVPSNLVNVKPSKVSP
jgi:hypothetical protein